MIPFQSNNLQQLMQPLLNLYGTSNNVINLNNNPQQQQPQENKKVVVST